ncbi:MAG: hypothetical protein Q4G35_04365 [Propionibacteriaceae bacterium]|nr:hypothetical protein [Propionibacteriaceae bacterium]
MITAAAFLGILIAIIPITVTPGASFTLVSSRGLIGDHRGA